MGVNKLNKDGGTWTGFLIMAFAVVGLVGGMAIYAAQIPFERALARSAALDQALAAANDPAKLAALRPLLDDSADHIITQTNTPLPDMPARITAERARVFAAFGEDARRTGEHLRLVLAVFTAMGALFGALVLGLVRRNARDGTP
jgi:hypothetical protein